MNRISLRIVPSELEDGEPYEAVEVVIDGLDLIERVKSKEVPFAQREGHPDIAGAYSWLPSTMAEEVLRPGAEASSEKVAVLQCRCGMPGCWPLLAQVVVRGAEVIWCEFEQPHRDEEAAAGHWRYEGFGPFVFDLACYEEALQVLAPANK